MSLQLLTTFDSNFYQTLNLDDANMIVCGKTERGLSNPSKMRGYAWSIPTKHCQTGAELAKQEGTSCSKCYANKARYTTGVVSAKLQARYDHWRTEEKWVEAITYLINTVCAKEFRWFDAGDLQGIPMLMQIVTVCQHTPTIKHWLPTQEHDLVTAYVTAGYPIPHNLTIRLSAREINGEPPRELAETLNRYSNVEGYIGTSRVLTRDYWLLTSSNCPSSLQGNKCQNCKACWERVPNINYLKH